MDRQSAVRITYRGGGYAVPGLAKHYIAWIIRTSVHLLALRPAIIHAMGLEAVIASIPARLVNRGRTRLIFDDPDRFSMCHDLSKPSKKVVLTLEKIVSRVCDLQIVPNIGRYGDGTIAEQYATMANTPSRAALLATTAAEDPPRKLVVLVTGWVDDSRGAADALGASRLLIDNPEIEFVVAGRLTGEAANELIEQANVRYLGRLSGEAALQLCADSSVVLTAYDPSSEINRYAAPNKWGDCIALGIPFVTNEGIITASPLVELGICTTYEFGNASALAEELVRLATGDGLAHSRQQIASLASSQKDFETQFATSIFPLIQQWSTPCDA